MAYADFPYYQDFYLGSMIRDPTAFGRAAERASEYLDMVTFGRTAFLLRVKTASGNAAVHWRRRSSPIRHTAQAVQRAAV